LKGWYRMKQIDFSAQLTGKTIDKIYKAGMQMGSDQYSAWFFIFTFIEFDKFLEIEGDIDGIHIRIKLTTISELRGRFEKSQSLKDPDLQNSFLVKENEPLGKVIGNTIKKCELGVDREKLMKIKNKENNLYSYIRFYFDRFYITVFEGEHGLAISVGPQLN